MNRAVHECAFKRTRSTQATNTPLGPSRITAYRQAIHGVLADFTGQLATTTTLLDMAKAVCGALKVKTTTDEYASMLGVAETSAAELAVYHSILPVVTVDSRMPANSAGVLARRLAGNVGTLLAGGIVPTWQVQPYPEWCLARVVYATATILGLELYSGLPAGLHIDLKLRQSTFERLCTTAGLLNEKELETTYVHPAEMYGAWIQIHIDAGTSLQMSDIRRTSSLAQRNRKLRSQRAIASRKCPHDFVWECYACPMAETECSLAVRLVRPPIGTCSGGHEGFLVRGDKGRCVTCAVNAWRQQRGIVPLYAPPKLQRKEQQHVDNAVKSVVAAG